MSRSMKSDDYLLSMAWAGELTSRLGRGDPLQEPLKHDFQHAVCVHQKPGECVGRPSQPRPVAARLAFAHRPPPSLSQCPGESIAAAKISMPL
jgi:hypothetical protein